MKPAFSLFTQATKQLGANPFMAQISTSFFIDMVEMACNVVQNAVNPRSPMYVQPLDTVSEGFKAHSEKMRKENHFLSERDVWGQRSYVQVWNQLEIIQAYVEWRNLSEQAVVGEERYTQQLVYHTLVLAHNWKVKSIKDTHQKNGPNFGSATGWQTISLVKDVLDWPGKWEFFSAREILRLPGEKDESDPA